MWISTHGSNRRTYLRPPAWRGVPHPRVASHPSSGRHNSLWHVYRDVGFLRVLWNTWWILLARWSPSQRLKRLLYRMVGAKVGRQVSFGFEATLDILFPQDITIGDDSVIGYDSTILCHGYMAKERQRGKVTIGSGVSIGARALVLPGVTIGDGATIGAMALVNRDVPPGEFWAGVPARPVRGDEGE